jgi:hypothetical protein
MLKLLSPLEIEGDAFGQIYEYFMGNFAIETMQKGGEFLYACEHRAIDRRSYRALSRPHLRPGVRLGWNVRA